MHLSDGSSPKTPNTNERKVTFLRFGVRAQRFERRRQVPCHDDTASQRKPTKNEVARCPQRRRTDGDQSAMELAGGGTVRREKITRKCRPKTSLFEFAPERTLERHRKHSGVGTRCRPPLRVPISLIIPSVGAPRSNRALAGLSGPG